MGKGNDSESIASTITRASELPDDTGGASPILPNLFGSNFPIPPGDEIVENIPQTQRHDEQIPGVPKFHLEAHVCRFVIGEDTDDSAAYEKLLNEMLTGKSIPRWEEKATLRDGTFIVTVCYFTKKDSEPKKKTTPLYDMKS